MDQKRTFQPGTYYIGDLCYAIKKELWLGLCDTEFEGVPEMANYWTQWGDGEYYDQSLKEYSVDSGTIGVVSTSSELVNQGMLKDTLEGRNGHLHTFAEEFECRRDEGTGELFFGRVVIETDPEDEGDEDWDDGCDEYDYEDEEE